MPLSSKTEVALVSGGFDPMTIGHVRLIKNAAKLSDEVWVILNNNEWLINKKGYYFMDAKDRAEILLSLKNVTNVFYTNHSLEDKDTTVCDTIKYIYDSFNGTYNFKFCNGGDRKKDNTPESELCNKLGIELMYNVGGGKISSSSELIQQAVRKLNDNRI